MRVCFISFEYPPKIIGGLGMYAEHLVRGLNYRGIEVYTITRGDKDVLDQKNYRIFTPDTLYWRRFFFIKRAVRLFHKLNGLLKFDLVHFNGAYPITRGLKLPTVCTFHSNNARLFKVTLQAIKGLKSVSDITYAVLKNPVGSLFDITMAHVSDKIICPSPSLAKDIISYCFVDGKKIHVIPNGIDLKAFDKIEPFDRSILLDKYAIEKDNFILFIGRFFPLKGIEYLIKAFKSIQKEYGNLKLVMVGSGSSETNLRKIVRDIKGVIFLGFVRSLEVKKLLYETSLALLVPSIYEVLPMVVLEAMACSKPIIATNVGGIPLMVKHGKNGFLVRPKDSESLVHFIKVLYENQDLGKKMGIFGRELVEKEFTIDKMVSKTLKVYESLL